MNSPNEHEIENLLRSSPQPKPPEGLKERLIMQASASAAPRPSILAHAGDSWFRRWWPALAPAGLSLACADVMAVQQMEMRGLKSSIQTLSVAASEKSAAARATPLNKTIPDIAPDAKEIDRLKAVVAQLTSDLGQLEQLR